MKKKKNNFENIKLIFKYLKPHKIKVITLTIILIFSDLLYLIPGYAMGKSVEYLTIQNLKVAIIYMLIYALAEFISSSTYNILGAKLQKIQTQASYKMAEDTYKKVLELPAYAFEIESSGKIIDVITSDTSRIIGSVEEVIGILSSIIGAITVFIYVCFNSWIIALEIVIVILLYILIEIKFKKKIKDIEEILHKDSDSITSLTNETVKGIREVKTLGIKETIFKDIKNKFDIKNNDSKKEINVNTKMYLLSDLFMILIELFAFTTAIYQTYIGNVSIAFVISMTYYIYRFTNIITRITNFIKSYESINVSMGRIEDILSNRTYKDVKYGNTKIESTGLIEFKDVSFAYYNEKKDILKNFNMVFEPNKQYAIVGASGNGKSTIFNLLTRLFEPDSGEILLDGVNIKDIDYDYLTKNISIIRQEPFLFNRSIIDNFKLIKEDVTIKEVRNVCKLASIDKYIMSLKDQYNTILGEGGVNLSGGQKQRLAIARTLLKESKVILLDEATSALDNELQENIKETIEKLSKNHTIIVIAHRLTTIINSDLILYMENGKITSKGTHKELMKSSKGYQKLYNKESILEKLNK